MSATGHARNLDRDIDDLYASDIAEGGGVSPRRESGRSLARWWGSPYHRTRILIGANAVGSALLGAGLAVALGVGLVPSGHALDPRLQQVIDVSAGSPAWSDGVRSGHEVIALEFTPSLRLRTWDGLQLYETTADSQAAQARVLLPLAAGGFVLGTVAIASLHRRRPTFAVIAAAGAIACLGSLPVMAAGLGGALVVAVAHAMSAMVIARRPQRTWLWGGLAVIVGIWLVTQAASSEWFAAADALRSLAAVGLLVAATARSRHAVKLVHDARRLAARHARLVGMAAPTAGLATIIVALAPLPAAAIVLLAVAGVLASARARSLLWQAIDRRGLARARARATLAAVEEERGRLASEIHDGPLQMLAAVIPRIERRPGSGGEVALLRHTADDLRAVSIALRPPVLDDLGLGAAIAFLADQASDQQATTGARITDHAGIRRTQRPPSEVELAVYRICQEAVANARSHGGPAIEIRAEIGLDRLQLEVIDDGRGFTDEELRAARRQGRLGMHTMRQRALAVDGTLQIDSGPAGTSVRFDWTRR